uniref:Molybdopterin synthase catalytic subunit n=1 Tax=Candidatus Kentrum sp. FM TaxID=2126340 RepID=A0A450SKN8_9GAMM|nr:MAG: molybdopterin synthase catalytic subunit [Candidatus Kentron sp. FM]VFJ56238.1 MAG: molybdopterin synthase catalytic subunit [Candidatus Kentron sp. FM]VFK10152.1 MAG: molybdopterin synthase catalytic subunit [Candidatus Kentron sp. FM]
MVIAITREPIDTPTLDKNAIDPACGAVLTFSGTVRNTHHHRLVKMLSYETYEPMARRELEKMVSECKRRWPGLRKIQVVHRFGKMNVTESSVYITVSSPHREDAFLGLRYIIDNIKKDVPFWKKEFYEDGESEWLHPEDGCSSDHLTLAQDNE